MTEKSKVGEKEALMLIGLRHNSVPLKLPPGFVKGLFGHPPVFVLPCEGEVVWKEKGKNAYP